VIQQRTEAVVRSFDSAGICDLVALVGRNYIGKNSFVSYLGQV
jgi:hypothetical protein